MPTLQDAQGAVDQGNLDAARLIYEAILQENPRDPDAWVGMAEVLTETKDKRICYENALKIDKNHAAAKEALRNLEPQANPLVAALQQQTAEYGDDDEFDDEFEDSYYNEPDATYSDPSSGPPTFVLVGIGLALSLVVFALGSGVVFLVLNSVVGP